MLIHDLLYSVVCESPDRTIALPAHINSPDIVTSEETGTLWLWAYPKLLGWPAPITWLFSPVTGRYPWPGDLWGVDSQGELLIVESKAARGRGGQDPFRDFIGYEARKPTNNGESAFVACAPRRRWLSLLRKEKEFIRD